MTRGRGTQMTDQQLENYIGSIKSGVVNSGEFVDILAAEIRRLNAMIAKVRALHPAQFTRADVMKILKEGDS